MTTTTRPTVGQVKARLMERDSNLSQFAKKRGYKPRMVQQTLKRFAGKNERQPRGLLTYRILRDLSREIEQEIIPGLLTADPQ